MKVAIIPARGGSKRIPRKNIREFCGHPMLSWPIRTAIKAGCFDRIIVSTDSDEIAQTAESYGAEIPFRRPAHLANDYAGTHDVVIHAIDWMQSQGINPTAVACIYPTAAFLTAQDILTGAHALDEHEISYAITVTAFEFPVQRAVRVTENHRLEMLQPECATMRSQDLEEIYHDAGALYWGRPQTFKALTPFFGPQTHAIVLPRDRAIDIDTPEDWRLAEALFQTKYILDK